MQENTFRNLYVMMKVLNLMSVCLFHSSVLWKKYKIEEKWRNYLNEVFSSGEDPTNCSFDNIEEFICDSDQTGNADDKLDYLADYYYGENWELYAQFQDWYYTYFGGFWVTDFEDDYV